MRAKEPRNVGLLCADFELVVGVLLNDRYSSVKISIEALALDVLAVSAVSLLRKPNCANKKKGHSNRDNSLQHLHVASILPNLPGAQAPAALTLSVVILSEAPRCLSHFARVSARRGAQSNGSLFGAALRETVSV